MLVGLISTWDSSSFDPVVAGKSRAALQTEFALALGCTRLIIAMHAPDEAAFRLQAGYESAECKIQFIRDTNPLLAAIKAEDELLLMDGGIAPLSQTAAEILKQDQAILTLDADNANVDGFERIDINHLWAGAAMLPGRLVSQLDGLPSDSEIGSTLLRLALQQRLPLKLLPDSQLRSGAWSHSAAPFSSQSLEQSQRDKSLRELGFSDWVAYKASNAFNVVAVEKGIKPNHALIGAGLLTFLGATMSLVSIPAAMAILAVAWIVARLVGAMEAFIATPFAIKSNSGMPLAGALVDSGLFLSVLCSGLMFQSDSDWQPLLFGAIALVASLRAGAIILPSNVTSILADRAVIYAALGVGAATFGLQTSVFVLGSILLLVSLIFLERAHVHKNSDKDNRELTESD